jgi:lipid-binding SYLF domain-containing protein
MRSDTLDALFAEKPEARDEVENSHAVAVFTSVGLNLFLLSTARGGGIVRETGTGKETFMRMFSVGGGFGMGVKDFRVIFIFHTKTVYENFLNSGWDFSGQADAAAKTGEKGASEEGAATVIDGVTLYQLTESGLALQVTLQGTKYYLDKDLN